MGRPEWQEVERQLRRRPSGTSEPTEQDRYYDGRVDRDDPDELPPWTDDQDDHEDEL